MLGVYNPTGADHVNAFLRASGRTEVYKLDSAEDLTMDGLREVRVLLAHVSSDDEWKKEIRSKFCELFRMGRASPLLVVRCSQTGREGAAQMEAEGQLWFLELRPGLTSLAESPGEARRLTEALEEAVPTPDEGLGWLPDDIRPVFDDISPLTPVLRTFALLIQMALLASSSQPSDLRDAFGFEEGDAEKLAGSLRERRAAIIRFRQRSTWMTLLPKESLTSLVPEDSDSEDSVPEDSPMGGVRRALGEVRDWYESEAPSDVGHEELLRWWKAAECARVLK